MLGVADLDTVNDLETTIGVDFTNITSVCPSLRIDRLLRVLRVCKKNQNRLLWGWGGSLKYVPL